LRSSLSYRLRNAPRLRSGKSTLRPNGTRAETAKLLLEVPDNPVHNNPGDRPPPGWLLAGSDPGDYQTGTDQEVAHSGIQSGFIASRPQPRGFGTLMQQFRADRFRGTRLRLSAYIRTAEVENWAALWMRVDGPEDETLGFDNMQDRSISGTIDWRLYRIVLDVPETATGIAFGVLLEGTGRVWLDDVEFDSVSENVPVTGTKLETLPAEPVNLDFASRSSQ
jgi:hypothetical protein